MSVREPWSEDVDVTEMGDADFEKRTASLSVWDKDGTYAQLADSLAEYWEVDRPSAIDRAIRLFLAKSVYDGTFVFDRDAYEIGVLIPPRYWVADHIDAPVTDVTADIGEGERSVVASIPPTVDQLITDMIEATEYEQRSEIAWDALRWLTEDE